MEEWVLTALTWQRPDQVRGISRFDGLPGSPALLTGSSVPAICIRAPLRDLREKFLYSLADLTEQTKLRLVIAVPEAHRYFRQNDTIHFTVQTLPGQEVFGSRQQAGRPAWIGNCGQNS